ncbi:MAG: hypothetical protein GX640_15750, partial [Fibrobacter sp.]|nr:hypothetical protein [Fibrobacter sp.]
MFKKLLLLVLLLVSIASPDIFIIKGYIPANLCVDSLNKQYRRIYTILNPTIPVDTATVTVIFYKQSEGKVLGVRLPEWGGGGAIGRDSIVIPIDRAGVIHGGNYQKILVHEITHIALSRVYGFVKVPRWFHEGLAMVLAGEISFEDQLELS